MFALFTAIQGNDNGKTFRLADGETSVIGRGSQCGIILTDAGVSRRHCRVRFAGDALLVEDLGSRNGTLVNGRKIDQEVRLADGDLLVLGEAHLRVQVRMRIETAAPARDKKPAPVGGMEVIPPRGNLEPMPPPRPAAAAEDKVGTVQAPPAVPHNGKALILQDELEKLTGTALGGCRIGQAAGQDEFSLQFRAVQISMEREVLLKVLRPQLAADRARVERFLTAARASGKLSHPNVLQVYDAGLERGLYFIALEFAGEETVQRRLEKSNGRPFALRHAVEIAEQIAGALDYAHSHNVLHRAVTPDNIVLLEHGIAKLANLGFARGLAESLAEASGHAALLPYAAPELLTDPLSESPRSDIYSLGGVLYLMVTGRPPAPGASRTAANGVRAGQQTPARQLRKEISDGLAEILDRAMAAAPAGRYGRASELQNALQHERERLRR